MKRIFQFSHCTLHLYRKKIILFSVLSIGSSLISLFNTLLSGRFIDFLASPNCVEWKPQLCYYCILFLATIMISFAISFALGRIREKLHTMVSYNINRQMLVDIQQIPFSKTFFFGQFTHYSATSNWFQWNRFILHKRDTKCSCKFGTAYYGERYNISNQQNSIRYITYTSCTLYRLLWNIQGQTI